MLDAIYLGRIIDRGIYQERQQAAHSHFLRSSANRPTGGEPNVAPADRQFTLPGGGGVNCDQDLRPQRS